MDDLPTIKEAEAAAIESELAELEGECLAALRRRWDAHWGSPQKIQSAERLRCLIAWRIQAEAYGGLDDDTQRRLALRSIPLPPPPPAGTQLTREYQGVLHKVEVTEDGFMYRGRGYGSLSEVARFITGTRWNGPAFFGLRRRAT